MKVRSITERTIIGGMAFYNDPAMSFMTELFNKDNVKYWTVPFDESVCASYLEGIMDCEIKISSYSFAVYIIHSHMLIFDYVIDKAF